MAVVVPVAVLGAMPPSSSSSPCSPFPPREQLLAAAVGGAVLLGGGRGGRCRRHRRAPPPLVPVVVLPRPCRCRPVVGIPSLSSWLWSRPRRRRRCRPPPPPRRPHAGVVVGSSWWGPGAVPRRGGALVLVPRRPLSPRSLLPSRCFEVHPFPPREQLLAAVVLGAEVVVVPLSLACRLRSRVPPRRAGGCWVVPLPCLLVFRCPVLVGPSSSLFSSPSSPSLLVVFVVSPLVVVVVFVVIAGPRPVVSLSSPSVVVASLFGVRCWSSSFVPPLVFIPLLRGTRDPPCEQVLARLAAGAGLSSSLRRYHIIST